MPSHVSWHCAKCGIPNYSSILYDIPRASTTNPFEPLSSLGDSSLASLPSPPGVDLGRPLHRSSPAPRRHREHNTRHVGKPLRVLNVNCQSIKNKQAQFLNLVDSSKPDVIIGTESWLDATVHTAEYFPPNFNVYRRDRHLHGGGVFIAVSSDLPSTRVDELETDAEIIWVRVSITGSRSINICGQYRPDVGDEHGTGELRRSLERLGDTAGHILIGGDFNLPGWDWASTTLKPNTVRPDLHEEFLELLHDYSLTQMVTKPTRQKNTLDLLLTNNPTRVNRVEVIPGISDHEIVLAELDILPQRVTQKSRQIPQYRKADWPAFRQHMKLVHRSLLQMEPKDVDSLWLSFKTGLDQGIKKYIPTKIVSSKPGLPWLTP